MQLIVYSSSESFKTSLCKLLDYKPEFRAKLSPPSTNNDKIHLLHISSLGDDSFIWLEKYAAKDFVISAVCSDQPDIRQMLNVVKYGTKGYCNSYMRTEHYQQMIRLLSAGQSWFPPQMLEQTFALAQQTIDEPDEGDLLQQLTTREKDTALAVSKGLSNKQIADELNISERTVKTHLTNIFKKLNLKDRVGLVLYLKKS